MNHYHLPIDPDRPLGLKAASAAIPALRHEAARLAEIHMTLSAHLRIYQSKVDSVLAVLAPDIALPASDPSTPIELRLQPAEFDQTETIIGQLQAMSPDRSIDDCLNEIFRAGLLACARL